MRLHKKDRPDLVDRILLMQGVGYKASELDSLPVLFKEIYGFPLKNCSDCKEKAFHTLVNWATKEDNKEKNHSIVYKIKPEFSKTDFVVRHQGALIVINADNLTDQTARILLAFPKYKHAIVGQEELPFVPEPIPPVEIKETQDTDTGNTNSPNVSEVVTASTSNNQNTGMKQQVHVVNKKLSPLPASMLSKARREEKKKGS